MKSKFFESRQISEGTTLIRGTSGENAYLIEGEKYALLIDTLTGAGNLHAFCRELTELPIHAALTHGHGDHSGGVFDFGQVSMHPGDLRYFWDDTNVEHRKFHVERANSGPKLASGHILSKHDFTPPCPVKIYPLFEGDVFDLGGRQIEVIETPGHSLGSITFLERARQEAYSGDACNSNTLLYLDGSTSIPCYREALLRWKKRQGEFDRLWSGHGDEPHNPAVIDEAIVLCDRILEGKDDAEERGFYRAPFYYARRQGKDDGMFVNIGYRKDWIHEVPPYRMVPLDGERRAGGVD
jgi:glyoxylase-like metal-dependent hydrolase (beta-lactamase superfamily II)